MSWLRDLPVLVLGLGESGMAMARWCARRGARVTVWDSRELPPHADTLRRELPEARLVGGELEPAQVLQLKLLLKSPGLAPRDPRIAPFVDAARAAGIAVLGELDLFVRALAELQQAHGYRPQRLAVTGTNGKTTTTAMTALLVERAGRRVAVAGNIMPTLLDRLSTVLATDQADWPEVWVLELSSFQLADAAPFEASAAAVLNLSQDHLDWHGDMAAYAAAKARILAGTGTVVLNRDDPLADALAPPPAATSRAGRGKAQPVPRSVVRFGLGPPARAGDYGLRVDNGMAWLVRALPAEEGARAARDEPQEIHLQRLMPADALRVRGRHNAANALAALALARPSAARWPRCCTACASTRRAAPRAVGRHGRRRRGLRRQQGHQRRRHRGRAGGPGRRQGAVAAGRHPGRRRQGPGLLAAGEPLRRHARAVA
jgi:UDP-N-acetylmuramoylalanine--D-glutamate ligase